VIENRDIDSEDLQPEREGKPGEEFNLLRVFGGALGAYRVGNEML